MDIHDLTVLAAAARHGSVTKAARSLSTVQSNVTTRIRLLETELNVQLFRVCLSRDECLGTDLEGADER